MKVNLTTENGLLLVTLEDGSLLGPLSKAHVIWDGDSATPRVELGLGLRGINTKGVAVLNTQTRDFIINMAFKNVRKDAVLMGKLKTHGIKLPDNYRDLGIVTTTLLEAIMDVLASMLDDVVCGTRSNSKVKKDKILSAEASIRKGLIKNIAQSIKRYKKEKGIPPSIIKLTDEEYNILSPGDDTVFNIPVTVSKNAEPFLNM